MLSGQSYLNKDIQLQVINSNDEGPSRIITQVSLPKSTLIRTQNETKRADIKQDYENSKLNHMRDLCHHPNRNLIKCIENTENLPHISITNSQSITYWTKFQKIMFAKPSYCNLKYFKWPLIFVFICTCVGLVVYTSFNGVNIRRVRPIVNNSYPSSSSALIKDTVLNNRKSLENSIDSKEHILDGDMSDTILKGSTTLLRPVIVPHTTQSDIIKEIHFDENIQSGSLEENSELKREFVGEGILLSDNQNKSEVLSLLGFTSGHQNNFGVPIEEDERILKLLNAKLLKLDQKTEQSRIVSQTESSLIVSPTLPIILHKSLETSTRSGVLEETQCQSTSLYMCRGVLQYDLTVASTKNVSFTPLEMKSFEHLFSSNCSSRVAEFVCSILEPECRPMQAESLQPCKRFCKSILEPCSALVITSDILTYIFDCDKYPDSSDNNVCEDPTRRGRCHENEFKCYDLSCIPNKWLCDNIKDCEGGDDELNCLICNTNEFRCKSNEKCVPDRYRCDLKEDCSDGSDESDCDTEFENKQILQFPKLISLLSSLQPNYTNRALFNTIFDDDRLPAESELNESVMSTSTTLGIIAKTDLVEPSLSSAYSNNSKEITVTNNKTNESNPTGGNNKTVLTILPTSCIDDQLRCVSGKCITVDQLCDRVVDCPEGEDEIMCGYDDTQSQP